MLDTPALWELFPPYPGEAPAATADLGKLYRELGVFRVNGAGQGTPTSRAPSMDGAAGWRERIADVM